MSGPRSDAVDVGPPSEVDKMVANSVRAVELDAQQSQALGQYTGYAPAFSAGSQPTHYHSQFERAPDFQGSLISPPAGQYHDARRYSQKSPMYPSASTPASSQFPTPRSRQPSMPRQMLCNRVCRCARWVNFNESECTVSAHANVTLAFCRTLKQGSH